MRRAIAKNWGKAVYGGVGTTVHDLVSPDHEAVVLIVSGAAEVGADGERVDAGDVLLIQPGEGLRLWPLVEGVEVIRIEFI